MVVVPAHHVTEKPTGDQVGAILPNSHPTRHAATRLRVVLNGEYQL